MRDDVLRQHVAQALTRAVHPETRRHLRAALGELDPGAPTGLVECPTCNRVGVPERIEERPCRGGRHE